jgi:hypothetical protein
MAEGLTASAGRTLTVMSATGHQAWFTRREGRVRGPYSSDHITRYILLGRIRPDDELSSDRFHWHPVTKCTEFLSGIYGEESGRDDYQLLAMARISADERRSERRQEAGEGGPPPGIPERRRGTERRQPGRNAESFVYHLMSDRTVSGKRPGSQSLRPCLLGTLLVTLVVAWFSDAFR